MAKKNGNGHGGKDVVLQMWEAIASMRVDNQLMRSALARQDKSLGALGRGLLRFRSETKRELAAHAARLSALEHKVG